MSNIKKPATLGKGLAALLPGASASGSIPNNEITSLPLAKIRPAANQPRKNFNEDALEELVESVTTHGVLQPLVVRPMEDHYVLIAGERRYLASKRAGLTTVPVVVKDVAEPKAFELALVENLQRENLDPVEEARAFGHLVDDFGYTHEEVASSVGKSRAAVTNSVRLLALPMVVMDLLASKTLSAGHARALLSLKDDKLIIKTAQEIARKQMSVRQAEQRVKKLLDQPAKNQKLTKDNLESYFTQVQAELARFVKLPLKIKSKRGGADLTISFRTLGEMENLVNLLKKAGE